MGMSERYRALGAVLALGEFSVPEITALSGVREPTVRTILRREDEYVEQIGAQSTGRRGGQRAQWRLRPNARERLRDLLLELERLGAGPWLNEHPDENHTPWAGVTAAEDILLRLPPASSDETDRADLVKLAQAYLDTAQALRQTPTSPAAQTNGGPIEAHLRIVRLLLELEKSEKNAQQTGVREVTQERQELMTGFFEVVDDLKDQSLADAIRNRLDASPLSQPWSIVLQRPAALQRPLHGPDPRLLSEVRRLQQRVHDLEAELASKGYAEPDTPPSLTRLQRRILKVIRESIQQRGYPPSINEIRVAARLTSTSRVTSQLSELESKGYLVQDGNRLLTVEVRLPAIHSEAAAKAAAHAEAVRRGEDVPTPNEGTRYIPLLGRIAAGGPIIAEEAIEDIIPLPERIVGGGQLFLLRVAGDSMINAAIADDDIVVIRQQPTAENGDIVAASIDGDVTIKSFKRSGGHVWLMPHNPTFTPIPGDEATILGRVVAVLRRV